MVVGIEPKWRHVCHLGGGEGVCPWGHLSSMGSHSGAPGASSCLAAPGPWATSGLLCLREARLTLLAHQRPCREVPEWIFPGSCGYLWIPHAWWSSAEEPGDP